MTAADRVRLAIVADLVADHARYLELCRALRRAPLSWGEGFLEDLESLEAVAAHPAAARSAGARAPA